MITPQDIREKGFDKAVFGGYDMGSVDDYLEQLANEVEAIQRENNTLRGKMKVLAEKVEDYRTSEGALNAAMLSAQKLSIQVETDARARAAAIVAEADAKAKARLGGLDELVAQEEMRLQAAKLSTAKFFATAREICEKQLQNLDKISVATRSAVSAAEPVRIQPDAPAFDREPAAEEPAELSENTQIFTFSGNEE